MTLTGIPNMLDGRQMAMTISTQMPSPPPVSKSLLAEESPPAGAAREFGANFSKYSVSYGETLTGGPPKDGICDDYAEPARCSARLRRAS